MEKFNPLHQETNTKLPYFLFRTAGNPNNSAD